MISALDHVFGAAHERQRNVIDAELDREPQVLHVLFGQGRQRRGAAGHGHAFALAEQAAPDDGADRAAAADLADHELDPAVIQQHAVAAAHRVDELAVADLDLVGELARRGGEHHPPPPPRQPGGRWSHTACRIHKARAN